ncbi:serum paraoxonase/arylesterase 2-like [Saccoglossus kowalevskii]
MLFRVVFLVILALVLNHVAKTIYLLGFFKVVYKQHPGFCRTVPGVEKGSEDVTVASNGLAFISSELNGKKETVDPSRMPPNIRGKIFLFDFNHPENDVIELPLKGDFDRDSFYPHGISLYEDDKTDEKRLFVVNHRARGDECIEIFRFEEKIKSLIHLKTIRGDNIYSVNDVVAVGPDSFYYTNDGYFVMSEFFKRVELFADVAWTNVGFYDGNTDKIVQSGLQYANGINVSPEGRYLYVSSVIRGFIYVFEIRNDNSIEEKQRINVYSGVDNIEIDKKTGDLWLGCNAVLYQFVQHVGNVTIPAPSLVLKVRLGSKSAPYDNVDIQQVFMDDGSLLKGSSVASYYDNKMLVGTVLDKLGFCEIKHL